MNANYSPTEQLLIARRVALIGFAIGIATMVALFVYGALNGTAQLMVISASTAAALGAAAAASLSTISRRLKEAQR